MSSMKPVGDIDIDVPPTFSAKIFPWAQASIVKKELSPHPCGVYPQRIPVDPYSKLAAIPYEQAEEVGYQKIDFLHLSVYQHFATQDEIESLLKKEPDWSLLELRSSHPKLFQPANHGDLLQELKPRSIEDLADVLALIRPAKKQLLGLYRKSRDMARQVIWEKNGGAYAFKKSHALGYALVIVLQLHLIEQNRL